MDETLFAIRLLPYNWAPADWQLCDGGPLRARLPPDLCEKYLGQKNTGPGCFTVPNLKSPLPGVNYFIRLLGILGGSPGNSYLGAVKLFPQAALPEQFILCDGSTLPVKGNEALYSVLGTTFGDSDGSKFTLPKLQATQARLVYAICNMIPGAYPCDSDRPSEAELTGTISLVPAPHAERLHRSYQPCDGRLVSTGDFVGLAPLIGASFGGNGATTVGMPKLVSPFKGLSYVMNCEGLFPDRR